MADASWEDEDTAESARAQLAQLRPPSSAVEAGGAQVALPRSASQQGRQSLEAAIAAAAAGGPADEKLDETLREALQGGGMDRNTVLRFDVECEKLLRQPKRDFQELPGPLNAFHRVLARKVAAHYGMRCEPTEGEGVLLTKTASCRTPPSRLQDVPVQAAAESEAAGAPPRVHRVMQRNGSGLGGGGRAAAEAAPAGGPASASGSASFLPAAARSVEEREAEYERARMRILGIAPSAPEQPPPGEAAPEGSEQAQPASEPPPAGERAEREPQPQPPPPPAPPSRQQQRATLRNRNADAEDPDFQRASPAHGRGGYQMGYAPQGAPQMYHPQMAGAYPGAYEGYAMPMPYGAQLGYPQPYGGPGMAYPAAASGPVVGGVHVRYAGGQQQQQQYWPAPGEAGSQGQGW